MEDALTDLSYNSFNRREFIHGARQSDEGPRFSATVFPQLAYYAI